MHVEKSLRAACNPLRKCPGMRTFVTLASLDKLAPGTALAVSVAAEKVALFNVRSEVFALDDKCVRCGSSLAIGHVETMNVSCPGCDWRYDLATGCVNGVPALQIDTFNVKIVDGNIMLEVALIPQERALRR